MVTTDIHGKYVTLSSATEEDAQFALAMRQDPDMTKYLPRLDISVEQQIAWIKRQREMEGDYFFIARNKEGKRVGVLGLYDFHGDTSGIGRIAMKGGFYANREAFLLTMRFAFKTLGLKKLADWVYAENARAIKFFNFFGAHMQEPQFDRERNIISRQFYYLTDEFDEMEVRVKKKLSISTEKFTLNVTPLRSV